MTEMITCHKCGAVLGETVTVDKIELLRVGGLIAYNLHATCENCGAEFYFNANGRKFNTIIRKWQEKKVSC